MSRDPMMQAPFWSQGLNGYAYVFNDPINNVDPTGFAAGGNASGGGLLMLGLFFGGSIGAGATGGPLQFGLTIGRGMSGDYSPGTYQMDARPGKGTVMRQQPITPLDTSIPDHLRGPDERTACLACGREALRRYGPRILQGMRQMGNPSWWRETVRYSGEFWRQQGIQLWNTLGRMATPIVNSFDPKRAAHIFRDDLGHVNPADPAVRQAWINIFERIASTTEFLRTDAARAGIIPQKAADAGVKAYTWTASTGQQIWVTAKDGMIQNAGVNLPGAYR